MGHSGAATPKGSFTTRFRPRFILLAGSAITLLPGHAAARADDATLCNGSNHLARIDACTRLMGAKGSTRDDQFRALINRAVAHFKRDEHGAAIRDFTLAITAGYGTAAIHESRGLAFLSIDDHERALADFDKSIALDPSRISAYCNRGLTHAALSRLDAALADYDQVIARDDKVAVAFNNRANVYRRQGDLASALADLDRAVSLAPDDPTLLRNRGITHLPGKN